MKRFKYPSTGHVSWSPGVHRDDDYHPDMTFFQGREIVVTEKLDGENATIYSDSYTHARSIDSAYHESRTRVSKIAARVGYQMPKGWRVCGENMQAVHSIKYNDLEDWFLAFSIWDQDNRCLSWDDMLEWCSLLDLAHVPVIYRGTYDGGYVRSLDERSLERICGRTAEGYVIRTADAFGFDDFRMHLAKWVRQNHVQTDEHWMQSEIEENNILQKTKDK